MDCWAPVPGHLCATCACGSQWLCILLGQCATWIWGDTEAAPYKAEDEAQSSSERLVNTSRISGHPLTVLLYEGEQTF